MAKKGQKFGKYSYELKMEIINKYLNNEGGYSSLSKEYNVPINTISTWIYQYKHLNNDMKGYHNLKGRSKKSRSKTS